MHRVHTPTLGRWVCSVGTQCVLYGCAHIAHTHPRQVGVFCGHTMCTHPIGCVHTMHAGSVHCAHKCTHVNYVECTRMCTICTPSTPTHLCALGVHTMQTLGTHRSLCNGCAHSPRAHSTSCAHTCVCIGSAHRCAPCAQICVHHMHTMCAYRHVCTMCT